MRFNSNEFEFKVSQKHMGKDSNGYARETVSVIPNLIDRIRG